MKAIIYAASTGKINRIYSGPSDFALMQCQGGEMCLFGEADDSVNYISQGSVMLRQNQSITIDKAVLMADNVDKVTLTGAPSGATITARNTSTGDTASAPCGNPDYFSTNVKGQITLTVSCWPYLDWSTTVTAQ